MTGTPYGTLGEATSGLHIVRPIVALHGVGFCFKLRRGLFSAEPYWALKDVSLDVREGESLGVIGGNGAGKSTLLRLLAGIAQPDAGEIEFRPGVSATLLSVGAGMQPNLSGRVNAIMTGLLLGVSRRELNARLGEIKEFSGLGDFFEAPVNTYSSGMIARLGFASTHIIDPDVLLIDEVIGVGDQSFRKKSAAVIRQRLGANRTVILVSHSTGLIEETCDRVLWIDHGRVRALGAPREVVAEYLATA